MGNPVGLHCLGSSKLTGTRELTGAQKHALQMYSYARLHLQDNYNADISCLCICAHACVSECMCSVYSHSPKEKHVLLFIAAIYHSHHHLLKQSAVSGGSSQCEREPRLWKHHVWTSGGHLPTGQWLGIQPNGSEPYIRTGSCSFCDCCCYHISPCTITETSFHLAIWLRVG